MVCPACGEPMMILEIEAIELDWCEACGGLWLDTGELEAIAGRAGAQPGRLTVLLDRARGGKASTRRCPRCPRHLREEHVATSSGHEVTIDRCPGGDGIWLDRGELRHLVTDCAGAGDAEQQAVARFLADTLAGVL